MSAIERGAKEFLKFWKAAKRTGIAPFLSISHGPSVKKFVNMPHRRRRKKRRFSRRTRRGKPGVLGKRRRRGVKGLRGLKKRKVGGYSAIGKDMYVPRSRSLFPFSMILPLHYHKKFNLVTGASGVPASVHLRMGSIFDPVVGTAGAGQIRVGYYAELAALYQNYVVKSMHIKVSCYHLKAAKVAKVTHRIWCYDDQTGTSAPTTAELLTFDQHMDNNNQPMKSFLIGPDDRKKSLSMTFRPHKELSNGDLMTHHQDMITGNPAGNEHNVMIAIEEPELSSANGVHFFIKVIYKTILFDPKGIVAVAAPED